MTNTNNLDTYEKEVLLGYLLYTMGQEVRGKLMAQHPAIYNKLCGRAVVPIPVVLNMCQSIPPRVGTILRLNGSGDPKYFTIIEAHQQGSDPNPSLTLVAHDAERSRTTISLAELVEGGYQELHHL